jgi:hypothetical protein
MQHIDNFFKKSLDSLSDKPGKDSWNKIKNRLDNDDAQDYRRKFIVTRRLSISLAVAFVGMIIYSSLFISTQNSKPKSFLTPQSGHTDILKRQSEQSNNLKAIVGRSNYNTPKIFDQKPVHQINFVRSAGTKFPEQSKPDTDSTTTKSSQFPLGDYSVSDQSTVKEKTAVSLKNDLIAKPLQIIQSNALQHNHFFKPFISLTFFASPVWSRHNLADNDDYINRQPGNGLSSYQQSNKTVIEQRENELLSYNIGLTAYYHLNKTWGLESGVIFNSIYMNIDPHEIYAVPDGSGKASYEFVTSSGYSFLKSKSLNTAIAGDSLSTTMAKHKIEYLSIPLLFKYTASLKRFSVSPGIGLTANFLTGTSIQTGIKLNSSSETVIISKLNGSKGMYLSASANMDIGYSLNRKWMISLVPSLNYAITPVTENNVVFTYPYCFGFGLGISYRFD